jgi:hypothetical protein
MDLAEAAGAEFFLNKKYGMFHLMMQPSLVKQNAWEDKKNRYGFVLMVFFRSGRMQRQSMFDYSRNFTIATLS